ncbi:MAG: TolC family protein [Gammaproteobacteria bacterium]|nr:TolC family protein [Gammaproteobacteria bacterium]
MKLQNLALAATFLLMNTAVMAESSLSLAAAEKIALERDLIIQSQQARSKAMTERSVSADSWADPVIKFGALAVPVDSYDLEQEQMTQVVIGYQQMLPRGDSAEIKSKKWLSKAALMNANEIQRMAMLKKNVRQAWLKVYLKEAARDIIKTNSGLFKQLVTVSQSQYVAGRKKQQDVLQAEVEFSLVEDKLEKAESDSQVARAALALWVGEDNAQLALDSSSDFLANLMLTEQQMARESLLQHPMVGQRDSIIKVAQQDVALANEKTSAQWAFDISYGMRQGENPAMAGGGERPDFLSMMAMVSIPMFTGNKQDRDIIASKQLLQAEKYQRQDALRTLNSQLKQAKVRWYKIIERIRRYEEKVLPQAKQNSKAAMSAYQSGVGSFIALTRARVSEFNAQLSHLKLTVEKANVLTEIRYLVGEKS